jgi:hypothetical protein
MKRLLLFIVGLSLAGSPALAVSFYISPDVPTDRAGTTYLHSDIVRNDAGIYSLKLSLPPGTPANSLYQRCDGDWLLSVDVPTDLAGTTYEARDVIRFGGAVAYSLWFCGGLVGIPASSDIDAAFMLGGDAGDLVISFDVPTDLTGLGGGDNEPSDLIQFTRPGPGTACNNWALVGTYFDASAIATPVPLSSIVTGSDERGTLTLLTFDVPTTLGGTTYMPGQIVSWDGALFASFSLDGTWPGGSRADAFSMLPDPGKVPPTFTVDKSTATVGDLTLRWSPATSAGGEDYGIYEGSIGSWASHTSKVCTDAGGDLTEDITPLAGDRYYLVVPLNPNDEGSYGRSSNNIERPQGGFPCRATQALGCP